LRQAYEDWWEKVSRQFDEEIPIRIGGRDASRLRLNTYDWHNEELEGAWNQCLVRQGLICNGYWEVEIAEAGTYRFALRRWPSEEGAAIAAGLAGGEPVGWTQLSIEPPAESSETGPLESSWKDRIRWGGGVAIPVRRARIAVAGVEASTEVGPFDEAASFTLSLPRGPAHLQTWLETADGRELGAYCVYVDRVGP